MPAVPETKANVLITELNRIRESQGWNRELSEFFSGQALAIREGGIGDGDMLLGMIAALNGDIKETRKRFRNAFAFLGHTEMLDFNYGTALYLLGDYGGAIQALMPYADKDKESAILMADCCRQLGLEGRALHYYDKAGVEPETITPEEIQSARKRFISCAMARVKRSFEEDREIWQSLSSR